eukprot:scaffold221_cov351-Pavlova_lutheri.AAC.25
MASSGMPISRLQQHRRTRDDFGQVFRVYMYFPQVFYPRFHGSFRAILKHPRMFGNDFDQITGLDA